MTDVQTNVHKIRAVIDINIDIGTWSLADFLDYRNEGTYCASNFLDDLEGVHEAEGCLCGYVQFEAVDPSPMP